jgi:hypothetical protein
LKKEGIDRSEYPKGTRFLFRGRKIQVVYPKDYKSSDSEDDNEKEKSESDSTDEIKESLTAF